MNLAKYSHLLNFAASAIFTLALSLQDNPVLAQISSDNTLGEEKSQVNSISEQEQRIDGGAIRNANLFHSFSEFNVREAETVNFANPDGVINIFSRVTGNNLSQILGDLGVLGDANLFLMNPNGIIFGEQASLNVNGSFIATTANSIIFADGNQFVANPASEKPLLIVNVPIGLQFANQPGSIINRAQSYEEAFPNGEIAPEQVNSFRNPAGLQIRQPNQTLALIGGEIILEGGNLTNLGGNIEVASIASPSLVSLAFTESGINFDYSAVENFGDITVTNRKGTIFLSPQDADNNPIPVFLESPIPSILDATSNQTSGKINLQGKHINILNGSLILTPTFGETSGYYS